MRGQSTRILALSFVLLVWACSMAWAQPEHVSYQGQLVKNGVPFSGVASFKFALVTDAGTRTLWSNDNSSTVGDQPSGAVLLPVDAGLFSARLGDPGLGMVPMVPEFLEQAKDLVLRVWVDTGAGFEQLTDQPVSSTAFAVQAEAAVRSLENFTVGANLRVNGDLGIGTDTPNERFEVNAGNGLIRGPNFQGILDTASLFLGDQNHYVRALWGTGLALGTHNAPDALFVQQNTGNVGIGTLSPGSKLAVNGIVEMAGFKLNAAPGTGYVLTSDASGVGSWQPGGAGSDTDWTIAGSDMYAGVSGYVGIGTSSPESDLHVVGETRADEFIIKNGTWPAVYLGSDPSDGGLFELTRPTGPTDWGITMKAAGHSGAAVMDLYNSSRMATVELIGDSAGSGGGSVLLGNGTNATMYFDGNTSGGGQVRITNNTPTITYQVLGQAYGSGSQTNMNDSSGNIAHQWTASNREWKVTNSSGTLQILTRGDASGGELTLYQNDGNQGVVLDGDNGGDGEIRVHDASGATSVHIVGQDSGGNGRVITDILEITGGADLSENFDINETDPIEPGTVVCIDPGDVGKLVRSEQPYERTVAGIVSGAGGVRPGMLMGQQGSVADGNHPVALTGRVWTWCDASDGPIEPGDLLTTSATPGHAMRVADPSMAIGAILGKAMSKLESGRGLVLVLVSLQ